MNLSDTDQAPYSAPAPQTATVSDDRSKYYIVWNDNRSEGFATDDYSDAIQVLEGEFHNGHTSLGYEFHESYGEGEKHFETVDPAALSPAEPVDQSRVAQLEAALTSILFEDSDKSEQQRMIDSVKARAVLEQSEPVDQWQDIATAPKHGKAVIVYDNFLGSKDGRGQVIARFDKEHGWHVAASVVGGIYIQLTNPIKWMPLPAAPTSKGGE